MKQGSEVQQQSLTHLQTFSREKASDLEWQQHMFLLMSIKEHLNSLQMQQQYSWSQGVLQAELHQNI